MKKIVDFVIGWGCVALLIWLLAPTYTKIKAEIGAMIDRHAQADTAELCQCYDNRQCTITSKQLVSLLDARAECVAHLAARAGETYQPLD